MGYWFAVYYLRLKIVAEIVAQLDFTPTERGRKRERGRERESVCEALSVDFE